MSFLWLSLPGKKPGLLIAEKARRGYHGYRLTPGFHFSYQENLP
jgi:hypothetical protein